MATDHRTTKRIECPKGQAIELEFPDGSVLRLRWDDAEPGIRVTAEEVTCLGRQVFATELVVHPRTSNVIILKAE